MEKQDGMYNSTSIAFYLTARTNEEGYFTNMTKVQKLLYIVYGIYLVATGKRLTDEHPQAWPYGPVFPETRRVLLDQEFRKIKLGNLQVEGIEQIKQDKDLSVVISFVLKNFGSWPATALSEWSHEDGSPWEQTTNKFRFKWGNEIDDCLIQEYFSDLVSITQ